MTAIATTNTTGLRRWWSVIAILIAAAFFTETVFAGAMLSGEAWARQAHAMSAVALIASTAAAALASLVTLRRVPHGLTLGLTLLSLAVAAALQIAVGKLSADGANLRWIHVPLGVALVALVVHAVGVARRLGSD